MLAEDMKTNQLIRMNIPAIEEPRDANDSMARYTAPSLTNQNSGAVEDQQKLWCYGFNLRSHLSKFATRTAESFHRQGRPNALIPVSTVSDTTYRSRCYSILRHCKGG